MLFREALLRLLNRFRYPVSLPEDITRDVGLFFPSTLNFKEFLSLLVAPPHPPTKLRKFMPRHVAEAAFESAFKVERFKACTLFSYYFNAGWLVFTLYFDENETLRRVHVQCPSKVSTDECDLLLEEEHSLLKTVHG